MIKSKAWPSGFIELGQQAGIGTDTLSFSRCNLHAIISLPRADRRIKNSPKNRQLFTPEQIRFIEICTKQIAMALEVDRSQEEKTRRIKLMTDRVRSDLLHSIFYNLSAPINCHHVSLLAL